MKKVKIIWPVPSFMHPFSFKKVGPFDKNEVVEFPEKLADLLIHKKRAKEIIIENPFEKFEVNKKNDILAKS
jgi:hypothetical protein